MKKIKFSLIFLLGIILFLIPIPLPINGLEEPTIFLAQFSKFIKIYLNEQFIYFTILIQIIIIISALIGIYRKIKNYYFDKEIYNELTSTKVSAIIIKILGASFFLLIACKNLGINVYFQQQGIIFYQINEVIKIITDPKIGQTCYDLVNNLIITFFLGNLLLPLLTDFGSVEFIGSLCSRFMKKIFKVPGYSAIDAISSFLGDGTIGILVTDHQYQKGYYTQKEAGIIASCFSIVGIAFAVLVAQELGLSDNFLIFYTTIFLTTIVIGYVIARMNIFNFSDKKMKDIELTNKNLNVKEAFLLGVDVCDKTDFKKVINKTFKNILITYITFVPTIMIVGIIGLFIAQKTMLFQLISLPLVPFIEFLGFGQDAIKIAPTMLIGFIDMYLPALLVIDDATISSASKFFVGVLSFSQLIFMSETGIMLLKTKIGFKFLDLIKLFLIRTLIAIPVILIVTYMLVYFNVVSF